MGVLVLAIGPHNRHYWRKLINRLNPCPTAPCRDDPRKTFEMYFYVSTLGACDLLFNARFTLRSVFRVPSITDRIRDQYIEHVTSMVLQGLAIGSH